MATNYSQVRYGAKGNDVKTLQEMLNKSGYGLAVDGVFGTKTQAAVKDYQKKNSLAVDGVVGTNTWGALNSAPKTKTSGSVTKPTTAAETAADMEFKYDPYEPSDAVKEANDLLQQYLNNKPGDFNYSNQDQLSQIMDQYLNRDKFSYDLNSDALYQQYVNQYANQGKLAMMDTMGQAAAMTGGYGNSYAQSVGQQTYQGYLQQANEMIPEFYQMALDKYNMEGDAMLSQYGLLNSEREQEYGMYRDQVADYYTELQRLQENARYLSEDEYNKYLNDLNFRYGMFSDDRSYKYQYERDAIADDQWAKEFAEKQRQYNQDMALNREKFNWEKAQYEQSLKEQKQKEQSQPKDSDKPTYASIVKELDGLIADGASKSQISSHVRSAVEKGYINQNQAQKLLSTYTAKAGTGKDKPKSGGFTGTTYSEAVAYMKSVGVPSQYASTIYSSSEWQRRKNSGSSAAAIKEFDSYAEYLEYAVDSYIDAYGKG